MDFEIVVLDILGMVLSFLTGIVLLSFHRDKNSTQRILAVYFLAIACGLALSIPLLNGTLLDWPHFSRTVLIAAYAYPPLAYLYVRKFFKSYSGIKDLINFIPVLFYIVDYLPYFLLPAKEKLPIIQNMLDNPGHVFAHSEGWLTFPWFHLISRNLVSIFYWVLSVRILVKLFTIKQDDFFKENRISIRWLVLFVILQFFFFFPNIFVVIIGRPEYNYYANVIPILGMTAVTCIMLFFVPSVFYGFKGILVEYKNGTEAISQQLPNEKLVIGNSVIASQLNDGLIAGHEEETTMVLKPLAENINPQNILPSTLNPSLGRLEYLNKDEVEKLKQQIDLFLSTRKPFLHKAYSITDFAKEIGMPSRRLSVYINHTEQLNYRDFINRCRIDYCMEHLKNGDWRNLTLEAIAERCGFNNRNSFTTAFKKVAGITPSAFLSKLKLNAA